MYKLCFYVPEDALEPVKNSLFAIGAGRFEHYEHVCWQCIGSGQFKPLKGANPAIGEVDDLTRVSEYKVEMLCEDKLIEQAVQALINAHPYEEVAYDVVKLEKV